jgi:hypothetical protein
VVHYLNTGTLSGLCVDAVRLAQMAPADCYLLLACLVLSCQQEHNEQWISAKAHIDWVVWCGLLPCQMWWQGTYVALCLQGCPAGVCCFAEAAAPQAEPFDEPTALAELLVDLKNVPTPEEAKRRLFSSRRREKIPVIGSAVQKVQASSLAILLTRYGSTSRLILSCACMTDLTPCQ